MGRCGRCTTASASSAGATARTTTARPSGGRPTRAQIADGLPGGIAADDFCGLHFAATDLVEAVSSRSGAGAYRVELAGGGVRETPIAARYLGA